MFKEPRMNPPAGKCFLPVYDVDRITPMKSRKQGPMLGEASNYSEASRLAKGDVQFKTGSKKGGQIGYWVKFGPPKLVKAEEAGRKKAEKQRQSKKGEAPF